MEPEPDAARRRVPRMVGGQRPRPLQLLLADNDRLGVSVGASYNWNERLKIDIGYAHFFVKDAPAAIVPPASPFNPAGNPAFRRLPVRRRGGAHARLLLDRPHLSLETPRRSRSRPPRSCGSTEAQQASSNKRRGRRQRRPFPFAEDGRLSLRLHVFPRRVADRRELAAAARGRGRAPGSASRPRRTSTATTSRDAPAPSRPSPRSSLSAGRRGGTRVIARWGRFRQRARASRRGSS